MPMCTCTQLINQGIWTIPIKDLNLNFKKAINEGGHRSIAVNFDNFGEPLITRYFQMIKYAKDSGILDVFFTPMPPY